MTAKKIKEPEEIKYCTQANKLDFSANVRRYIDDHNIDITGLSLEMGFAYNSGFYNLLARGSWKVEQLLRISIILRHNFFKEVVDFYKKSVPTTIYELQHNEKEIISLQQKEIDSLKEKNKLKDEVITSLKAQIELMNAGPSKKNKK